MDNGEDHTVPACCKGITQLTGGWKVCPNSAVSQGRRMNGQVLYACAIHYDVLDGCYDIKQWNADQSDNPTCWAGIRQTNGMTECCSRPVVRGGSWRNGVAIYACDIHEDELQRMCSQYAWGSRDGATYKILNSNPTPELSDPIALNPKIRKDGGCFQTVRDVGGGAIPCQNKVVLRALRKDSLGQMQANYACAEHAEILKNISDQYEPWHSAVLSRLRSATLKTQREGDLSYLPIEPESPFYQGHNYWWTEEFQSRFEALWSFEGDLIADRLADTYSYTWPWLIADAVETGAPELFALLSTLSRNIHSQNNKPLAIHVHSVITHCSYILVRKRRSWEGARNLICPACQGEFWGGFFFHWSLSQFGPVRYCQHCILQVRNGNEKQSWSREEVINALENLTSAFGHIPSQGYSFQVLPIDAPVEKRDSWVRAMVGMPDPRIIKTVLGAKDWLGVLQAAEIVGDTWRPSYGTWCRADDGHLSRSLLEKSIDDWFNAHGIEHECEPIWPYDPQFNPSGKKRADWLLSDGSYVECAGMLENKRYAERFVQKRELAQALGIKLHVIIPTDLLLLDEIFASQIK